MSISGLIKSLGKQTKSANTGIFSYFSSFAAPRMTEKEFMASYRGWVYACVNAISDEVAGMELKLQGLNAKGEWQDVKSNPAMDLLHNVNPFMSFNDLFKASSSFIELHGNCFWYLPSNGRGKPTEIWLLDPLRTWVVKSPTSFISGYVFINEQGTEIPFEIDEIIHFKTFNPTNPYRGMGTVEAAAYAIDIDTYSQEYQRNFFHNGAAISGVLSTEGTLSLDQYDRIRENWKSRNTGVRNAHKMAILEGGLKWQATSISQKDMEYLAGRQATRDEILAIFRVPKSIIGITEDVNRANAETSDYVFAKRRIRPQMQFIVSKLSEFYLPLFNIDQSKYRLWFTDPVPENQDSALAEITNGRTNNWMTINEARVKRGLKPVEGGDELYISNLLTPINGSNEDDSDPNKEDEIEQEEENAKDKNIKKKSKKRRSKKFNKESFIANQVAEQKEVIITAFDTLQEQLLNNLKNKKEIGYALLVRKILETVTNKDATTDPENELVRILFSNYDDWIGLLFNATKDGINNIYTTSGKQALLQVGVDAAFNVDNPAAMDYLNNHALDNATQVSSTIKEDLTLQIMQGVESGASDDDIATTITNFFDTGADWRADRIARTETINAFSQGSLEGYKQSGVVSGKQWLFDDGKCDSGECPTNADAGTVGIDESFPSGDDAPPAHPNCECTLLPVVASDE